MKLVKFLFFTILLTVQTLFAQVGTYKLGSLDYVKKNSKWYRLEENKKYEVVHNEIVIKLKDGTKIEDFDLKKLKLPKWKFTRGFYLMGIIS